MGCAHVTQGSNPHTHLAYQWCASRHFLNLFWLSVLTSKTSMLTGPSPPTVTMRVTQDQAQSTQHSALSTQQMLGTLAVFLKSGQKEATLMPPHLPSLRQWGWVRDMYTSLPILICKRMSSCPWALSWVHCQLTAVTPPPNHGTQSNAPFQ